MICPTCHGTGVIPDTHSVGQFVQTIEGKQIVFEQDSTGTFHRVTDWPSAIIQPAPQPPPVFQDDPNAFAGTPVEDPLSSLSKMSDQGHQ